jgi:catechol 2,3-dioxygenase-like lactoylglutathione lyase family enzyme
MVAIATACSPGASASSAGSEHVIVERIDHVTVAVSDLDAAKIFYEDLTGQQFYPLEPLALEGFGIAGAAMAASGLELVEARSEGKAAAFIERAGEAVLGMALKVVDLEQAVAAAERRGLRLLGRDRSEVREVAVFDPEPSFGVMLKFVEYMPGYAVSDLEIVKRWRLANGLSELPEPPPPGKPTMRVQGIDHILVFVKDIERARHFFSDLLGSRFPKPHLRSGARTKLSVDGLGIELIAGTETKGWVNRFIGGRKGGGATGEGVAYVSMKVDSYQEAHAALAAGGYREVATTILPTRKVALMVREEGPGIGFEIIEYRPLAHRLVAQEMIASVENQPD